MAKPIPVKTMSMVPLVGKEVKPSDISEVVPQKTVKRNASTRQLGSKKTPMGSQVATLLYAHNLAKSTQK